MEQANSQEIKAQKKMKKWTQWEAALTHAISLVDCEKEEPVAI